jgi:hypothetical protein
MTFSTLVIGLLTVLCFLPYPAVPVGNYTGLQGAFLFAPFVALYACFNRQSARSWIVFLLIMVPYVLAGTIALILGNTLIPSNTYKAAPALALSIMPILAFAPFCETVSRRTILLCCAAMVLFHGLFGLFQWFAFARGVFPLMPLFNNNSFTLADNDLLGRPMGLFPEPSAMAAVLGPFIMLLVVITLDRRDYGIMPARYRPFLLVSVLAGLALLALSKTGFVLPFAAVFLGVVAVGLPAWGATRMMERIVVYAGFLAIVVVVIWLAWDIVEERFSAELNNSGSWSGRLDSIAESLRIWTSRSDYLWFGVGSNQSHLHMEQTGTYQTYGGMTRFGAVYSVIFTLLMETGLMGVLAWSVIAVLCVRAISRSGYVMCGYAVAACWVAGASVTTSYLVFPGLWLCLGLLVNWDRLFPVAVARPPARPNPSRR